MSDEQSVAEIAAEVLPRGVYEGDGGWRDGRLGQVNDLLWAVLEERGEKAFGHPLLAKIELMDGEGE